MRHKIPARNASLAAEMFFDEIFRRMPMGISIQAGSRGATEFCVGVAVEVALLVEDKMSVAERVGRDERVPVPVTEDVTLLVLVSVTVNALVFVADGIVADEEIVLAAVTDTGAPCERAADAEDVIDGVPKLVPEADADDEPDDDPDAESEGVTLGELPNDKEAVLDAVAVGVPDGVTADVPEFVGVSEVELVPDGDAVLELDPEPEAVSEGDGVLDGVAPIDKVADGDDDCEGVFEGVADEDFVIVLVLVPVAEDVGD